MNEVIPILSIKDHTRQVNQPHECHILMHLFKNSSVRQPLQDGTKCDLLQFVNINSIDGYRIKGFKSVPLI